MKSKDQINRQEAIDALVKAIREDPYYDSNEPINGLGVCDVRVIINDLPPAQRWIPYDERLPETNGQYLVTRWKGFSPKEMIIDIARYANGEWHKAYPIEAYMPLPEPYRKEGGEG